MPDRLPFTTTDRLRAVPFLVLLALAPACGPLADDAEPGADGPAIPDGVTGTLTLREGDLMFRPCGAAEAAMVTDGTGEDVAGLVRSLGSGDGGVTAHMVLGDPAIEEVRVASPESPGCEELLPDADLRAGGNEPFWSVDVEGDAAVFRSPEELEGIRYGEGRWTEIPGGWRFRAVRDSADGSAALSLEVRPGRCIDTMSGAWFPFTASVRERGRSYAGCAREGRR